MTKSGLMNIASKGLTGDIGASVVESQNMAEQAEQQAENELADSNLLLEGKGFLTDMKALVATENPSIDTLTKFYKHAIAPERAHTHAEAAKFLAKEMAANKTRANDAEGTRVLMARAENNEIITDEEIDKWNFSPSTKALVKAEVAKRNQMLPQTGDN